MDTSLWKLFWTTGLPEAYALAKHTGSHAAAGAEYEESLRVTDTLGQRSSDAAATRR